jgi:hypothetical protein
MNSVERAAPEPSQGGSSLEAGPRAAVPDVNG